MYEYLKTNHNILKYFRSIQIPVCSWIDIIKMDLLGIGLGNEDGIGLTRNSYKRRAVVNVVMDFKIP
jgi:hypothetical protein